MIHCDILRDLLPLYADGLTSPSSNEMIEEHIKSCPECRRFLEHMCQPIQKITNTENTDYKRALLRQKRRITGRTLIFSCVTLLVGTAITMMILWSRGTFDIADRQTSPNGAVTTTAYSKNISGLFPSDNGFTIRDTGQFEGTTNYLDASFDGMWWSPDSHYLVISMQRDNSTHLEVIDYLRNSGRNLSSYLDRAIYQHPDFSDVPYNQNGNPEIEYRFLQWSEYDSTMLLYFSFVDYQNQNRSGYFWYDYETGAVSGVSELPVQTADGDDHPALSGTILDQK